MFTPAPCAETASKAYLSAPFYAIVSASPSAQDAWKLYARHGSEHFASIDPSGIEGIARSDARLDGRDRVVVALNPPVGSETFSVVAAYSRAWRKMSWQYNHEAWGAIAQAAVAAYAPALDCFVDPRSVIPTRKVTIAELRASMTTEGIGQFVTDDDLRNLAHRFPMPVEVID